MLKIIDDEKPIEEENINKIGAVDETSHLYDPDFYKPNLTRKYRDDYRFIVVSCLLPFAVNDVWTGYSVALERKGYKTLPIPTHNLKFFLSEEVLWKYIHSKILDVRDNFTHVIFIGGHDNTVPWMLKSLYDKKSIVITTEDPHGLDKSIERAKLYDYCFTNERNACQYIEGSHYLPTAANHYECMPIADKDLPDNIKSDILFLGNVYPNRQIILEGLIPIVEKRGYKFQICGLTGFMDKNSPLVNYVRKDINGMVLHNLTVCLYNAAKIIINVNRDPFWEAFEKSSNRMYKCVGDSMNPRFYEVGMCGKFQLIDDSRKEVFEMFKCNQGMNSEIITYKYDDPNDLCHKVDYYLQHPDERDNIAYNFHQNITKNHSYLNRVTRLINFLNLKENPQKGLEGLMKSATNKNKK